MFEKLINMFIEKKYEKTNERYVGLDTWGNPKFEWDWATKYKIKKDALVVIAIVGVILAVIVSSFVAFKGLSGSFEETTTTTTTVVVEETTTTQEVYEYVVYGPEYVTPVRKVEYVCDTPTISNEWKLMEIFTGYNMSQVDWREMADRTVVFQWNAGDVMFAAFEEAVALVIEYTRADIRVVYGNYIPLNGEYVIPVTRTTLEEGAALVQHYYDPRELNDSRNEEGVMVTTGLLMVATTYMEVDYMMEQEKYEYALVNVFLHEIGHVFGLDHTHEEDGMQVDSVMSYESEDGVSHYLPGDIAGLKEVFC